MFRPFLIIILLISVGLIIYTSSMPYYTNIKAKNALDNESVNVTTLNSKFKDHYYSELAKLKTNRTFLEDLGSGLLISSVILLLTFLIFKIRTFTDLPRIKSLSKTAIWIITLIMWLALFPATLWYYGFRDDRGDYPWFADTIGIPIFTTGLTIIIGFIPLIIFLFISTTSYRQPVNLFIKYQLYTLKQIVAEVFLALLLLLNVAIFIALVMDGDHATIPINLYFTYLILVLRAGNIYDFNSDTDYSSNLVHN